VLLERVDLALLIADRVLLAPLLLLAIVDLRLA